MNCRDCKHWGTDGRRKLQQVCAYLSDGQADGVLDVEGNGCPECWDDYDDETGSPYEILTGPDFGCVRWRAK